MIQSLQQPQVGLLNTWINTRLSASEIVAGSAKVRSSANVCRLLKVSECTCVNAENVSYLSESKAINARALDARMSTIGVG